MAQKTFFHSRQQHLEAATSPQWGRVCQQRGGHFETFLAWNGKYMLMLAIGVSNIHPVFLGSKDPRFVVLRLS